MSVISFSTYCIYYLYSNLLTTFLPILSSFPCYLILSYPHPTLLSLSIHLYSFQSFPHLSPFLLTIILHSLPPQSRLLSLLPCLLPTLIPTPPYFFFLPLLPRISHSFSPFSCSRYVFKPNMIPVDTESGHSPVPYEDMPTPEVIQVEGRY